MEILKKITRIIGLVILTVLFITNIVYSQNDKALQDAFTKSYTYEYDGEYTKAIDILKKVYNEDSYEINLRLGWLTYLSGLFTESTTYYERAISLKPLSIEAHFGYVYPASALGNWNLVKNHYLKILEIDPQNTLANYRLGLIYYGNEDYATAEKCFEKVLNLYPFDYDTCIMYAWTSLKLSKFREAKVLFNKALLIKPNDESALEGLGLIK